MTDFFEQCQKHFFCDCFYDILEVSKTAKTSEIKKAYYKKSLSTHPDKVPELDRETATVKFQILSKIYSVLQDEDKRAVYDQTGTIDDDCFPENKDWYDYWRCVFKKVSLADIDSFEKEYKNSEEELGDLKKIYLDSGGNMETILNSIMCATDEDEPRLRSILIDLIQKKELPAFDVFLKEDEKKKKIRKKKYASEAKEAEEMKTKLGLKSSDSGSSLQNLILKRRANQFNKTISNLEEKYCKPAKNTKNFK